MIRYGYLFEKLSLQMYMKSILQVLDVLRYRYSLTRRQKIVHILNILESKE